MPKFKIHYKYITRGYATVIAKTVDEAKEKFQEAEDYGDHEYTLETETQGFSRVEE